MTKIIKTGLACALAMLCTSTAIAQPVVERPPTPGTPATIPVMSREIMPGLFLFTGRGGNSVIRMTSEGLIAIDNKVMRESVYKELNEAITKHTGNQTIKYAFITHHHADHGGNNARILAAGAELIGHANLPTILKNYKSTIAPQNPAPPSTTFELEHRIKLGGVEAIAYHWGPGHTSADIAVYFPDQRVVVAGDMLHMAGDPAVDILDGGGSLIGFRDRIDDLLKLDFVLAIPGHGENAVTRAQVMLYRERVHALVNRGIAAVARGVKPDELREAMRSDDLGIRLAGHFWTDPKFIAPIYEELKLASQR